MTTPRTHRLAAAAALGLVIALQLVAVAKQSLVGDAPYHLLAGHQALRYGENRLNLEHPPLVKLVAALPLAGGSPLAPPITVERALETSLAIFDDPDRLHRTRISSRLLVLLGFGFPFLAACFFLGREAGGSSTGTALLLLTGLSISTLPNLSILQTDAAVALGFTLTVAAALRYLTAPSPARAAILGAGLGLALAAKFSGVLAVPTALLAFALARGHGWRRGLRDLALTALVAIGLVWSTYAVANRRYDPEAGRDTIGRYCRNQALIVDDKMERYEAPLVAIERVAPNLAQWLTGLAGIRIQNAAGVYPSYAFGTLSSQGRWWYFPAVLLAKTPLVVLVATLAALLSLRFVRNSGVVVMIFTAALYLGVAMTSNYNLGVRHLMPILPLLYLPAAWWVGRCRWRSAVVVGVLAIESLALAPLWMSATNTWWLGRYNPTRFAFSVGDAEYRQNFIALADAAAERGLDSFHVLYPQVSEREIRAYMPRAVAATPGDEVQGGTWYAVSVTLEQFLPAIPEARDVRGHAALAGEAEAWRPYWREIVRRGEDHGYVAATFHLYRLPE